RNRVSRTNVPKQSLGTRAQTAKPRGCGPGVPGHLVTLSPCHLVIMLLAAFSLESTPWGKASRPPGARNCDAPFAHAAGNGTMRESVRDIPGPWTTYHYRTAMRMGLPSQTVVLLPAAGQMARDLPADAVLLLTETDLDWDAVLDFLPDCKLLVAAQDVLLTSK